MRIHEILFWNDGPTKQNRSDPQLNPLTAPFNDDLTNLANAFTRRGLVKHFWNLNGSEGHPSEPASPDAEPELIPNGTLEPPTASWEAEAAEEEPPVGLQRLIPFRQYRGVSGD